MLICVVYAHKGPTMEIIKLFYSILFYVNIITYKKFFHIIYGCKGSGYMYLDTSCAKLCIYNPLFLNF